MTQNPGSDDPYQHDPDRQRAEQPQGGYQSAPGYESAPVHDGGAPGQPVAKPSPVSLAEKLMYTGGVLSLLSGLLTFFTGEEALRQQMQDIATEMGTTMSGADLDAQVTGGLFGALIGGVVYALIWFLLGFFNGKGKGWARIVATVLGVLNVVGLLVNFVAAGLIPGMGAAGTIPLLLGVVSAAIAAVVVFLLWRKESSAYFRATR